MGIREICDMLRAELYNNGFEYGFIWNGQKYKPDMKNGFDHEYDHLSKTVYCVQDPNTTGKKRLELV